MALDTVQPRIRRPAALGAILAALLVWVAVVFAAYYGVHKPFPAGLNLDGWALIDRPPQGVPFLGAALDLGAAAWLSLASLGTGHALLRALGTRPESVAGQIAFSLALGFGALGLATLGLGVIGFFTPIPMFFILGTFSGLALLEARRWYAANGEERHPAGGRPRERGGWYIRGMVALLALTAFLIATRALTPPIAWDAYVYHLTGPQLYIRAGGIIPGIDIPHLYFPSLVEQLFTAALLVRGDIAAQLLHLALAGAAALAVFGFLDLWGDRRAAWVGAALLASTPSLVTLARIPYVEWGVITFGFLSFWALQEALERLRPGSAAMPPAPFPRGQACPERSRRDGRAPGRWLVLSGILAGLALGVKYTAFFLVLGIGLVLLRRTRRIRSIALWWGAAAMVASPWFLKNLALTGNPLYPFLFEGWQWDAWKTNWFSRAGTGLLSEPWRLLTAPWEITVLSSEGGGVYDIDLGPLFLALLPLLLVPLPGLLMRNRLPGTPEPQDGRPLPWTPDALVVAIAVYAAWLLGAAGSGLLQQGRLLVPTLAFLACLIAARLTNAGARTLGPFRPSRVLEAAVLLALCVAALGYTARWAADAPIPYLLRTEGREEYLARHLGDHYAAMDFLNRQVPSGSRTLFLWEPRSYLCEGACQPDALLFNWRYLLQRHGTAEGVFSALRAEGYTHLLLYGGGLRFFSQGPHPEVEPEHIATLMQLESRHLERVYGPSFNETLDAPIESIAGAGYAVYRVRGGDIR